MLRAWLELARISNLPTVWTNVTAAWLLAGGPWWDARLAWLLLAGSLLYTAGMILNDVADAGHDRLHKKERPIPTGRIPLASAWIVGGAMMVLGMILATGPGGANGRVTLALAAAILFYDLYHKPWPGAVWVMGACRVLLYAMAASAVTTWSDMISLSNDVLVAALALGAYIVGLTQVARMEAKGAVVKPWQVGFARTLLFAPAIVATGYWLSRANWKLISLLGDLTPLAPAVFILIFIGLVLHASRVMKRGGPAIGEAVGLLLAGIAIVDALAVMQVSLSLACMFVGIAPLLRLWQRWIAAT
ncbi:4-hydroxybenzoate polyprenyltransferase [Prosthecobacter debontii]|uniref:4-hydroxybenzoate polyprenyltransferase n=1 Tax=Prosthecobacter debontii TaxID=48467 RepID=A0A1T4WKC3_9BACT|nr:UbiA family prenyltransferase [Prosthecobacter debontii]SKA77639.1 4-hydroxybenzoate polyprenyltransferase [Prosthecobacter debontii]